MKKTILLCLCVSLFVSLTLFAGTRAKAAENAELPYTPMDFSDIEYPEDVEEYDYIEPLTVADSENFKQWINDIYDLSNPITYEYVLRNFNKLILKGIRLGYVHDFTKPQIVPMFGQENHRTITKDALNILENDQKGSVKAFFDSIVPNLLRDLPIRIITKI